MKDLPTPSGHPKRSAPAHLHEWQFCSYFVNCRKSADLQSANLRFIETSMVNRFREVLWIEHVFRCADDGLGKRREL